MRRTQFLHCRISKSRKYESPVEFIIQFDPEQQALTYEREAAGRTHYSSPSPFKSVTYDPLLFFVYFVDHDLPD